MHRKYCTDCHTFKCGLSWLIDSCKPFLVLICFMTFWCMTHCEVHVRNLPKLSLLNTKQMLPDLYNENGQRVINYYKYQYFSYTHSHNSFKWILFIMLIGLINIKHRYFSLYYTVRRIHKLFTTFHTVILFVDQNF